MQSAATIILGITKTLAGYCNWYLELASGMNFKCTVQVPKHYD